MDPSNALNEQQYDTHAQQWSVATATNVGHKYLEKPAMEHELPDALTGQSVLCIGVGSGEELSEILKRKPTSVTGIDLSEKLLQIARSHFPTAAFEKMDMMHLTFPDSSFDFVYSSLTFHYAKDWDALLMEVRRVMKPGGVLLFSTHHPGYWSQKPATGGSATNERGITLTEHTAVLPGDVEITYYNHPDTESILEALRHAGFAVEVSYAPAVIALTAPTTLASEEREAYLSLKAKNEASPLFFIVKAVRKA